jgi:hypothetical protein
MSQFIFWDTERIRLFYFPQQAERGHGGEVGYSLEVFNALGGTIAVTTVPESVLEELTANDVLHKRSLTG